jgi:betaine-aldehyde dehydrogenase
MRTPVSLPQHAVLINNVWLAGDAEPIEVFNPVTGERITRLASASAAQVDAAARAAQQALINWRLTSPGERGALLRRIARQVEAQRPQLEQLQQLNSGKPAGEAALDVSDVVTTFNYYAGLCDTGQGLLPENVPLPDDALAATLERVPVGVVGLIVPWNYPMVTTAWKVAPALAAGCTVVLKPSELTPLAEIALMDLIVQAGLPVGVVNMVYGAGAVGQAVVQHPAITKISFTGSNATGQRILQACGPRMQRVSLELGGKSSLLVLDDADLEQAIALAIAGSFFNAGQMCSATSRICVARPLFERFVTGFVTAAEALQHGDPHDARTTLGPIVSRQQQQSVLAHIQAGLRDGARLMTGGHALPGLGGYAVAPTIFTHAEHSAALWREEIFGPVACVRAFEQDDDAIDMANDSEFGLVATVVSGELRRAHRVAGALEVGTVWINTPQLVFPQTGWGGFKHSGLGRELGPWGIQAFQELRHTLAPLL